MKPILVRFTTWRRHEDDPFLYREKKRFEEDGYEIAVLKKKLKHGQVFALARYMDKDPFLKNKYL